MGELDDVLALLVLLTGLERVLVLPAQRRLAAVAVDVRHRVQACQKDGACTGPNIYEDTKP